MTRQDQPVAGRAPDAAESYERAKPRNEAGMGRLDNNAATPTRSPDSMEKAAVNKQNPEGQLNGEDSMNMRASNDLASDPDAPSTPLPGLDQND